MMLTAIPPRLLHRVRDAAAYVHDLAELGLALLCPCDDTHGLAMRQLAGDTEPLPLTEEEAAARCGARVQCPDPPMECTDCPWDAWRAAHPERAA